MTNLQIILIFKNIFTVYQKITKMFDIEINWSKKLIDEIGKPYFSRLIDFVENEYNTKTIFPPIDKIFNAFNFCSYNDLRVVIIGQDPYHGERQANGLCFSVYEDVKVPPSLVNIFKEIKEDLGKEIPKHGNLERWAKQGILLINAVLTVEAHKAGSHRKIGWENFTDAVIKNISDNKENVVFLLWGNFAKEKKNLIDKNKHFILEAAHPSPLSAYNGFFGCKHFSKTNKFLKSKGLREIDW